MSSKKLTRWLDLLAELLGRRSPATFAELARAIPGYSETVDARPDSNEFQSTKRQFERDKDELRGLGIPILTTGSDGDSSASYRLATRDFYLPYLALASERGIQEPKKVDSYGYHSLEKLIFEPDELEVIREAAQRAIQAGDPELAEDAQSAIQKLAFDLPLGATEGVTADSVILPPAARANPEVLEELGDALLGRKRVSFTYQGMKASEPEKRTVEPYGLFFLNGHWYLAARDVDKNALRNFRVSRIEGPKVNTQKSGTPDYEIPEDFQLKAHARSKLAWELGDSDVVEAVVEFRANTGAVKAAAALGKENASSGATRTFDVRRLDSFARWLFSFGGDAVPVAPQPLVEEYAALVAQTAAIYQSRVTA